MKASSYGNQGNENDCNSALARSIEGAKSLAFHHTSTSFSDVPNVSLDHETLSSSNGFNLRKRSCSGADRDVGLSTYNSAFLSGLFADIAKANEIEDDSQMNCLPYPCKKSRVFMTQSIPRCEKSFANLHVVSHMVASTDRCVNAPVIGLSSTPLTRDDSLSYQLRCVSSASSDESNSYRVADFGAIAFPHLPVTISNSSCDHLARLTRRNSDQLLSDSETDPKECYGWFVHFDEEEDVASFPSKASPILHSSSSKLTDLAFTAAVAPKRSSQHDAEVEWAKAADTVDDVLGDFF